MNPAIAYARTLEDTIGKAFAEAFEPYLHPATVRHTGGDWSPAQHSSLACSHELVEVLSVNGRNLDGAVCMCARCGAEL